MKTNGQSKIEPGDRAVAIYHVVYAHEGFEESAQNLFKLIQEAQQKRPGTKRKLYLDIEGHRNSDGSFDADMSELLQEFFVGVPEPFPVGDSCAAHECNESKRSRKRFTAGARHPK